MAAIACVIGFFFKVTSVGATNGCAIAGDFFDDKATADKLLDFLKQDDIKKYYSACIGPAASGDLVSVLGDGLEDQMRQLKTLTSGFDFNLDDFNVTATNRKSFAIPLYQTEFLNKFGDYSFPSFPDSSSDTH